MGVRGTGWIWVACVLATGVSFADATVKVEPGQGVTVASEDGETSINVGFYGQFRFQVIDRKNLWRRSDLVQAFPPFSVENVGRTEPSFQVRRFRLYAQGTVLKK
jgi:hypothetical protein